MAQVQSLARPYARAAFAVAHDVQETVAWSGYLAFAATATQDPQLRALLGDPRVTPGQLVMLHMPPDAASGGEFARFLELLADAGRLSLLPAIREEFESLWRAEQGALEVRVVTAQPLDEAAQARLSEALSRRYASRIQLSIHQDPSLVAGILIEANGEVIDGSVRGRLDRLSGVLTHNL